MNEPTYTPHIGQPYEAPQRRALHTESKSLKELLDEMTKRLAAVTAERDAEREARKSLTKALEAGYCSCATEPEDDEGCRYCENRARALALAAKLPE